MPSSWFFAGSNTSAKIKTGYMVRADGRRRMWVKGARIGPATVQYVQ